MGSILSRKEPSDKPGAIQCGGRSVVRMSAAALRYTPQPDRDAELRNRIVALAHGHRRYGAGMIYLKLPQEGRVVNHKRVDRLYAEARLQVKRAVTEEGAGTRPPAVAPPTPPQRGRVGRLRLRSHGGRPDAEMPHHRGRCDTEAVAIVPARALGGLPVTRVLEAARGESWTSQVLRTDNGPSSVGAMLTWAHERRLTLRLIEPGKPMQKALCRVLQRAVSRRMPQRARSPAWRMPGL